jgi:serine/threonine-protein kinase
MKRLKRLIVEIHHRSLWQVLLIYVGGAWVCYEIIDTITDRLVLPEWLPVLAIILFLIGLPVVLATAFVGEVEAPSRARAEAEAAAAHHEARRRHRFLTWRNAAATFVIVLAAWGIVATGWLVLHEPGATPPTGKSVAVLPFVNLSADPENEYFSDGITDAIITHLTNVADLKVTSRTSSMQYKGTEKSLLDIAAELGVTTIVEGSVQQTGDRVRVNAQLIDAQSDEHLWAEIYDRDLTDIFAVQSDIAQQVATALRATLTPDEREHIEERPTDNLEAYDYYLRGLEFMGRSWEEHDTRIALEMFERATQLDSNFARAYAKVSQAHSRIYWMYYDRSQERLQQTKQAADRSLELEPDLPEGHEALGYYYYWGHLDYERALREFETALSRQPGNGGLLEGMGFVERRRGNFQAALAHFERAAELDPRDAEVPHWLAQTHWLLRDYPEAERHCDRALALAPDWMELYADKGWLHVLWQGNTSKARAALEEAADRGLDIVDDPYAGHLWVALDTWDGQYEAAVARLSSSSSKAFSTGNDYVPKALLAAHIYDLMRAPELARQHYDSAAAFLEARIQEAPEDSRLYGALGTAYAGLGRVEDAIRAGERGVDLLPVRKDAWHGLYRVEELARIFTMVGRHDAAIDRIEFLLSAPGTMSVARLRLDPTWDPLRDHPRFQALLERYE